MKKIITFALIISLVASMAIAVSAGSLGQKYERGDVLYVEPGSITIDGIKDAAYDGSATIISNLVDNGDTSNPNQSMTTTRVLWDGEYIYFFSEVKDNTSFIPPLPHLLTQSENADSLEYIVTYDNSDCEGVDRWDYDSSYDFFSYRATCDYDQVGGAHGGYFVSFAQNYADGYADGAEDTAPFLNEAGSLTDGKVVVTPVGFNAELKIKLPTANRAGEGSYTFEKGTKIGICIQQNDIQSTLFDFDHFLQLISDPARTVEDVSAGEVFVAQYHWYVELGGQTVEDTTPVTTSPSADKNPQTSDLAFAGAAILATLALAGVVVARKIR